MFCVTYCEYKTEAPTEVIKGSEAQSDDKNDEDDSAEKSDNDSESEDNTEQKPSTYSQCNISVL
jgi:hypothetical protein